MMSPATDVTQLLLDWSAGDADALDRLVPLVSEELRRRAGRYLRRERAGHTLQPTALVNEAYLRLVDHPWVGWRNRAHFFAIAARVMRQILVDHARRRRAAKRGETLITLHPDDAVATSSEPDVNLIALDEALAALAGFAPRQCRIIELRFFGGLTIRETAEMLEVSPATVKLDWSMARAWLFKWLEEG